MKRFALLAAGAVLLAQQPPAAPQTQPAQPAPKVDVPSGYNLRDASLLEVIDILARSLKINYILDAKVKGGSVTINTYGSIKAEDIRPILETILRMNNLAMVEVGNFYRIVQAADAPRLPISPSVNQKDFPDDERMLLNLVFLKFMTAAEMETILKPFVSESATISIYGPANLLMIQDNSRNMRRSLELINLFDSDQFAGQRVQTFTTQNSRPSDLAKELETVFKAFALSEKASAVRFLPIDRINTILAVASNPGIFKEVANWVGKLDIPVKAAAGAVDNYVYRLKYGRAENVGDVISQLYGGGGVRGGQNSQYNTIGTRTGGGFLNSTSASALGSATATGGGGVTGANTAAVNGTGNAPPAAVNTPFGVAVPPGAAVPPGSQPDQTGQFLGENNGATRFGGLPRIVPNPLDNTLLVQATPQQWQQILKLLDQLDVPPRQVLIDAKIYEVDLTGAFASGVEAYLEKAGATDHSVTRQLLGFSNTGQGFPLALSAGLLVGHSRQLIALISAQESSGRSKVISAPSIIATDSIPAAINVGQTVPTLSAQAVGNITSGGTSQFTQSIQNQSTGVALNILARVNASGVVTMVIDQSVSAPLSTTTSSIQSPSFSQREVSTQVTVQDGDTIAIGGIIQEANSENSSGIPFLHRLPYIGAAFGNKSYTKSRTELIIFLTPRVIYDTNQVAEATEELRQKVKNLTKLIKDQ